MNEQERDENPQNPLSRRIYLVSPKAALLARLGIAQDHPAAEVTAIITPKLRCETWFEGWRSSWRSKAKSDFLTSFIDLWSSQFAPASVSPEFIALLQANDDTEKAFDTWWTLKEGVDLIEIADEWRPS